MTQDDLLDALAELKHDLGKYLLLPISFLPDDASEDALREALRTALLRTRMTPRGVRSAARIWTDFFGECGESLAPLASFEQLRQAVMRALAWEEALPPGERVLERAALFADLGAVSPAVQCVLEEVQRG